MVLLGQWCYAMDMAACGTWDGGAELFDNYIMAIAMDKKYINLSKFRIYWKDKDFTLEATNYYANSLYGDALVFYRHYIIEGYAEVQSEDIAMIKEYSMICKVVDL